MLGSKVHHYPRLEDPVMVAALPDMGNVAGLCISTLVKGLDAELFAEIYAYWPPYVTYRDGIVEYKQSTYRFYASKRDDIVIFGGDFNPTDPRRLYEVCYEVIHMAQRLCVRRLYTVGAALRPSVGAEPRVYAAANNTDLLDTLKEHNIHVLEGEGQITGFNGLLLAISMERGIDAICILGEIDNPEIIQPRAAKSVLEKLFEVTKMRRFSLSELDEEERRKRFMEEQLRYMSSMLERDRARGKGRDIGIYY
ncbi:MAG: PAC2 family protein [Candidatus Nitrosocaldus sp.]|nr:PAC2 family protein [Candidatus Nitrosocaldus sp.]MDW8000764.1 PAC2 family protein [Candidatus Nitrosocaldus sp.]